MRYIAVLIVLVALAFFINLVEGRFPHQYGDEAVLVLGFVLLSSFMAGRLVRHVKMPMITGYLLAGLILGPHVIGRLSGDLTLFSARVLEQLQLIDELALGLIAFTAGGELRLIDLKPRWKTIVSIAATQTIVVGAGVVGAIWLFAAHLPFLVGQTTAVVLAAALLLGLASTATSPSTTIAVITELRAKGPLTTVLMGVTVFKDVITLVAFSFGLVLASKLLTPGGGFDLKMLAHVLWEVLGSLGAGLLLGVGLRYYIRRVDWKLAALLLAVSFLAMRLGADAGLSGILICVAAGFYVENFTSHGPRLIEAIGRYSLPVFVVFFTMAGAKIDIPALRQMWLVALLLIATRLLFTFVGTYVGARVVGGNRDERRLVWMGFIGQAGITLGLAMVIGRVVPVIGADLRTLIIAVIAVNQLLGPILLRFALFRAGEARV